MRIVSWNCQQGFINKDKYKELLNLKPDIAVVQECVHPNSFNNKFEYEDAIWRGKNQNKGLCVISFSKNIELTILEEDINTEWVLPIKVSGSKDFILLAVWTTKHPNQSYGKYLFLGLKEYEELYGHNDTVIIGDFNVDQKLPLSYRGTKGLEEIGGFLNNYGIHSCYHFYNNEKYGQESKPTYYHHRKPQNPFHIDHCFVSEKLLNQESNISIGDGNVWSNWSDHCPLIFEVKG